jgi:hypothetical protein
MPRASHRVVDDEPLRQRTTIVTAGRPDGEHIIAAPDENDLLVTDVAEQRNGVGD